MKRDLEFDHLSPSSLDTWSLCQRKFLYQHLLRIPSPYSWQAFGGTLYHKALEYFYFNKANNNQKIKTQVLLEKAREDYDDILENQEVIFEDDLTPEKVWKKTSSGVSAHISTRGKFIVPAKIKGEPQIEISVTKPIPNNDRITVTGRIDLLTRTNIIIDHKTRNMKKYTKKHTVNTMTSKHAPEVYQYLLPQAEGVNWEVTLIYVEKNQKPYPYTIQYPPYNLVTDMGHYLNQVAQQIESCCETGLFVPSRFGNYLCNEKYCSYWDICQGGKKDA